LKRKTKKIFEPTSKPVPKPTDEPFSSPLAGSDTAIVHRAARHRRRILAHPASSSMDMGAPGILLAKFGRGREEAAKLRWSMLLRTG